MKATRIARTEQFELIRLRGLYLLVARDGSGVRRTTDSLQEAERWLKDGVPHPGPDTPAGD